jgi:hypothetical protein
MAESARIGGDFVEWFNSGEFGAEEVLASFDDPDPPGPAKLFEEQQLGRRIASPPRVVF